ncbi:MAG: UvrD-helicase domain-containing protein [Muribaculaceae bacterium]|nr:UvrD-helicase domain-containing protein [Muribaculaceae bacterium]
MLTIYKASAGSGKTYTLAFEYIKALLGIKNADGTTYCLNCPRQSPSGRRTRNRHRGILAITFTNKATDEMKARIVRELNTLASPDAKAAYAPALEKLFGCTRSELADEAAAALRDILYDYRNFNVSTIDSFFQMVLRTFAREVDHQGDYEVELNDRYAVAAGVGMLFDDLNFGVAPREQQIKDWIAGYMRERIARGRSFNVFDRSSRLSGEVVRYVHKMCGEDFKPHAEATIAYLDDPSRLRRYRAAIAEATRDAADKMQQAARTALEGLDAEPGGRAICRSVLTSMLETAATGTMPDATKFGIGDPSKAKTFKAILERGEEKDIYTASKLPKIKSKPVYPSPALTACLRSAAETMQECFVRVSMLTMLADATTSLEFLGLAWQYVADYRRDNNLVLMSDTNDLLRRIINGAEVPFIYERIGVELHHFLIDEFQDTSVMQWENLRPLVANGLAEQADSLIIGDEKQAIYRFRNSDSSLLHHRVATEDFPRQHRERGSEPADNTNHRSAHGIVRFNNALFSRLADSCRIDGYENVRQSLFDKFAGMDAFVCLRPMDSLLPENADGDGSRPSSAELREASIDAMAAEIVRQHDAGYPWSRIAVLVRRRAEAQEVVDGLMRRHPHIPLLSNEGLRLDSSAAVRMIVSILKFVDHSYTPSGANGDAFATYGDILLMLSRFEYILGRGGCTPAEALAAAIADDDANALADEASDVRAAHAANLPALVEVIISRNVPPEQREREFAYIAAFQDTVLDYCAMYNPSVHAFLSWWERNAPRLTVGAAATLDAVAVMTVHKAKGLEWDCVHIPFANWEIDPRSEDVWLPVGDVAVGQPSDRPPVLALPMGRLWSVAGEPFASAYAANAALQVADNMNMTYVAFTRPVRELHVHYDPSRGIGRMLQPALQATHPSDTTPEGMPLPSGADPDTEGVYTYGAPTAPAAGAHDSAATESACPAPPYAVCFRDDTRELTTVVDITTMDPELGIGNEAASREELIPFPRTAEERARARAAERGNDLHNILALMRTLTDLPRAIATVGTRAGLSAVQRAEYSEVISEAMQAAAPHTDRWFDPGARVLAERTIYVAERGESFRPDRIIFYPDGSADVVDYKFTAEPRQEHSTQVRGYLAMLRAMGHTRLRGFLWYPELHIVQEV